MKFSEIDCKDAWGDGYRAYQDEQHGDVYGRMIKAENPYDQTDQEELWAAWEEGYSDAAWDD